MRNRFRVLKNTHVQQIFHIFRRFFFVINTIMLMKFCIHYIWNTYNSVRGLQMTVCTIRVKLCSMRSNNARIFEDALAHKSFGLKRTSENEQKRSYIFWSTVSFKLYSQWTSTWQKKNWNSKNVKSWKKSLKYSLSQRSHACLL